MRLHWTVEDVGYALRDPRGYTRACITSTGHGAGFYGVVFQRGLPDSGPYKNRQDAADWVQTMIAKLDHTIPADATFSDLPPWTPRKTVKREAQADTLSDVGTKQWAMPI